MSMPPQGGWQPPQQPGSMPPNHGGPYQGSSGPGPQQPYMGQQPPGYPHAPWPPQGVPPQKDNNLKWLLVAIAVLLVIGVTIGATLLFTRGDRDPSPTPSTSASPGNIASEGDTGPVSIITDAPTCQRFNGINNALAGVEANGWSSQRSALGPASDWTPDQRAQVTAVATAMRNAGEQSVALAKQTPNRLVRELYEQFIAYGRSYADSIDDYTPADNHLASVNVSAGSAIIAICNSITYGSTNRAVSLEPVGPPTELVTDDPAAPQRFVTQSSPTCTSWVEHDKKFDEETADWSKMDTSITGAQWTPEQRAVQHAVLPVLSTWANDMEKAGRKSGDPVLEDFAVAAALYVRAYVSAGDTYIKADSFLTTAAFRFGNTISEACLSASG